MQTPDLAPTTEEVTTKYGRELSMEDLIKRQGVRLFVLMDGEFKDTPRNRAERRAAEEQLTSVARMQIKQKMATWGKAS